MSNPEEQVKQTTIQTGNQMKIATRKIPAWGVLIGTLLLALGQALGQSLPLQIRQDDTQYNYQSAAGVPLSSTSGDPAGSDGRAPRQQEPLTINPPTANQFSGFISWGAVAAPAQPSVPWDETVPSTKRLRSSFTYAGNAANIGLPHGPKIDVQVVLQRAQVGAPYLSRSVSFLFGDIISPPEEDEDGNKLESVLPSSYWLVKPHLLPVKSESAGVAGSSVSVTVSATLRKYSTGDVLIFSSGGELALTADASAGDTTLTGDLTEANIADGETGTIKHELKGYYYSPHARTVFAIQPGPIEIIWLKATPHSGTPTDSTDTDKWHESVGNYYRLYKKRYLVSGSATKTPRKIYWNQAGYDGPHVSIPTTVIGDLHIVYNSSFPEEVTNGIQAMTGGATSSGENKDTAVYKYTLKYESDSLKALNATGRVFVELLSDLLEDGETRHHLGFEIVDVFKHSTPAAVTTELGDLVLPANRIVESDALLHPKPVVHVGAKEFAYKAGGFGGGKIRYYAARETKNLNDYQIDWMEEGLEGILWPARHVRYKFIWPEDPASYSHYLRPTATAEQAASTAVKLPLDNVPFIQYQDPLDRPRAHLSPTYEFYTDLDKDHPQHRTLLRFTSGKNIYFERVFSWLESGLLSDLGAEFWVPARDLKIWGTSADPLAGLKYDDTATDQTDQVTILKTGFLSSDQMEAPRYITQTVDVGARIQAPTGELGAGDADYWAGYILVEAGDAYNENAYIDPIVNGFEAANLGAIIPVNADPNADPPKNIIEVYWYRKNGADAKKGFKPTYWPAAFGRYTLQWPGAPKEIVLASNDGSGALSSLEANGSIYVQNDSTKVGYNPNEEHALMLAGQAYALRDDLNITSGEGYSSDPHVLLSYTGSDGRPSMSVFKVLREKPSEGIVFDYITEAGQILQAPMPLPLLAKPVGVKDGTRKNYNTEPPTTGGDLPGGWYAATPIERAEYDLYQQFTYEDRKGNHWVYRGLHAGPPALVAGTYDPAEDAFDAKTAEATATAKVGVAFSYTLHTSRRPSTLLLSASESRPLPAWLSINGMTLSRKPHTNVGAAAIVDLVVTPLDGSAAVTKRLNITISSDANVAAVGQAAMDLSYDSGGVTQVLGNRPPALAAAPTPANSFAMRFYYKTLPGFAWPGEATPPVEGSIVPYLRPVGSGADAGASATESLEIVYRPVWPADTPVLNLSETLTNAKKGLPAVRGQSSLKVLYQQAIAKAVASGEDAASVTLHDPTREKSSALVKIPSSVKTSAYFGKTYFPNLPPHLSQRLFYDPNRGSDGELVFGGKFVDEAVGEKYLLLNVLSNNEVTQVKALCATSDPDYNPWTEAINDLTTKVETFYEPVAYDSATGFGPGQWVANTSTSSVTGYSGDSADGAKTYRNIELVKVTHDDSAVDSYALSASGPGVGYVTLISNDGNDPSKSGLPVSVHIIRVGQPMYRGEIKVLYSSNPLDEKVTFQHTADLAAKFDEFNYEWMIQPPVDGADPKVYYASNDTGYDLNNPKALASGWTPLADGRGSGIHRYMLGGSGIQTLSDNYIIMRYRPTVETHPGYGDTDGTAGLSLAEIEQAWSEWTVPQLAEGWIKRVLAGINPFEQRATDMFNNSVNTQGSMLTQAGKRWEGDIALNLENINDHGLLEIYETVLNRGKMLSLEAGINYGPANDALLLAAGYINDLYMMVGNDGWADAANPTIGIGTKDRTYGDIATALFAFKGQMPSLLEEELALLRGRDDFMQPGVETGPVYNRMFWNYTRGIDSGEVIYALNYNIQEDQGATLDGAINAADAARMYPQGHGDAYGHYLSALKGYYKLLTDVDFTWTPRTEAVTVLGKPVQVDYMDERKFAAAASALARAGNQIFDLTWRRDYEPGQDSGWAHFEQTRQNDRRSHTEGDTTVQSKRRWGMDHWASRNGIGTMVNWVVGNAMLPAVDTDPAHEGIQKIDRTTVPELNELTTFATDLQTSLDNAEGHLTPLGLPEDALAFDVNPNSMAGKTQDIKTHYEQIKGRANKALANAVSSFDDSKDVTRLMRSEEDSLTDLQSTVAQQELAYNHQLIELYGTPYPSDVGPGKTYEKDYYGPDLVHFMYPEIPEEVFPNTWSYTEDNVIEVNIRDVPKDWLDVDWAADTEANPATVGVKWPDTKFTDVFTKEFNIGKHGFLTKPSGWTGKRASPGELQQAMSDVILTHNRLRQAVNDAAGSRNDFVRAMDLLTAQLDTKAEIRAKNKDLLIADEILHATKAVTAIWEQYIDSFGDQLTELAIGSAEALPSNFVVGMATGGDLTAPARAAMVTAGLLTAGVQDSFKIARISVVKALEMSITTARRWSEFDYIAPRGSLMDVRQAVYDLTQQVGESHAHLWTINEQYRKLDDARARYRALVAKGDRIQLERTNFRKRSADVVQGFRTRDAAFRIFRNEKLERYKTLYDLAAQYTYLSAKAYDYETGLLNTAKGREFIKRIVNSRALGVVKDGEPQYAASNTGDPGLSSILAEMHADWDVLKGRLGFNNPDTYGTTVSMRGEKYRILPGADGLDTWRDVLENARRKDIRQDADVSRFCMQVDSGDGLPVPGLVIEFSTVITDGLNLFGNPLAPADSYFSPSSFANKIHAVGIAFNGYKGMTDPNSNSNTVGGAGGTTPATPGGGFLDPSGLSATPYVYLVPVGVDSMRSPPLGDAGGVRSWNVQDVAVPMPFNIGASELNSKKLWQSSDSLSEELFTIRKHQAFRAVSTASVFNDNPEMLADNYTNTRLIGRSVWNSKWKLVIPGRSLLNDPDEGLDRFIQTVNDIQVHFHTYSYSGN